MRSFLKKIFTLSLFLLAVMLHEGYAAKVAVPDTVRKTNRQSDTIITHRIHEDVHLMRGHLITSPHPVSIRQQGRQLCVTSQHRQLLPIYKSDGTFFSAFRLYQGINWLTGLPRGSYYINNQKYTIK